MNPFQQAELSYQMCRKSTRVAQEGYDSDSLGELRIPIKVELGKTYYKINGKWWQPLRNKGPYFYKTTAAPLPYTELMIKTLIAGLSLGVKRDCICH